MTSARPVHTPGPWSVELTGRVVGIVSRFGDVAMIYGGASADDETLPNARLVAAAPDLLEAVEALEHFVSNSMAHSPRVRAILAVASAAIRKARES
jgi:hypothetical protein